MSRRPDEERSPTSLFSGPGPTYGTVHACAESPSLMLTACSPEVVARPDVGPVDASRDAETPLDVNLADIGIAPAAIPNWLLTVENGGVDNEVHRLLRVSVARVVP